jgi:putative transposase
MLKERGLKGVQVIISDACIGLAESAAEFFPDAAWQRCVVHWYRNIFNHVPSTQVREIALMLKAIHAASEDIAAAREKAVLVIEKLRASHLARAAELAEVEVAVEETRPITPFRRSTGDASAPITRFSASCARSGGARAVGAFPDGIRPSTWLRQGSGTSPAPHGSTKGSLNIDLLKDQQMRGVITAWARPGRLSAQTESAKNSGHHQPPGNLKGRHWISRTPFPSTE